MTALGVFSEAVPIPFNAGENQVLTNQAAGAQFVFNTLGCIYKTDVDWHQARLVVNITSASASTNTPKVRAVYATSVSTPAVIGDFSADLGQSTMTASLASAVLVDTGWIDIAAAARVPNVYIACEQSGGDVAADPRIGTCTVWLRRLAPRNT